MKQVIRLTENDLHKIVEESVRKILNEYGDGEKGQETLGAAYMKAMNDARSMDGKKWQLAREIAKYAAKQRNGRRDLLPYFIGGMNKARNR